MALKRFTQWLQEYDLSPKGEKFFRSRAGAKEAAKEKGKGIPKGKAECPNCKEHPCTCGSVPKSLVRKSLT